MSSEHPLTPYGWSGRWAALLALHPDTEPARVLRHDGAALLVATTAGVVPAPFAERLAPEPAVGDWVALANGRPVAVLDRTSSLTRGRGAGEQVLAANVDLVLLVCGLDRPVRVGRIERAATLAWDAGATPVVVLSKADLAPEAGAARAEVMASQPLLDVHVVSVETGAGLELLARSIRNRCVVLLGESGAGKSSLTNALLGDAVAAIGRVRSGDAKGRHTTTARCLYPIPGGGTILDTPGIRAVALGTHRDGLDTAFADVDELAVGCRFRDCAHGSEPGCAVRTAVESGALAGDRFDRWLGMRREVASAERRATEVDRRAHERRIGRAARDAIRR